MGETDGFTKQYIFELAFYLKTIVLLVFKISIYRSIRAPGHCKYDVYGLNSRDKKYLREQMNRPSKSITKNCEGLGMLHSTSNSSTISFSEQCKYILTEDCLGKIVHYKTKKDKTLKGLKTDNILFKK